MTDLRQAAQQALEALEELNAQQALEALEELNGLDTETECVTIDVGDVIAALRAALEQQAEPVAYVKGTYAGRLIYDTINPSVCLPVGMALYTTPPQRPWVGLEIEEVQDSYNSNYQAQTRAVEKLLKERNG